MSTELGVINDLVEQYTHRTVDSIQADADARDILNGYMDQQGVEQYSDIESDFPYPALLGHVNDTEGDVTLSSHYTFPDDESYSRGRIDCSITANSVDDILEDNVIPSQSRIIDTAGVKLNTDKQMSTPSDESLKVQTVHCLVFYEEPVVTPAPDTSFNGRTERISAREAIEEPSLATALVHSGKNGRGENFAEARIDYWTRTFDGIDDGLDYTSIDWETSRPEN